MTVATPPRLADARHVVNHLLDMAQDRPVTPLQMNKLVYYCHGWMLGIHHEPLIRQNVEAWRHGPVIRIVYQKLKQYRGDPIAGPIRDWWTRTNKPNFTEVQRGLMAEVWDAYGFYDGLQLSTLTHKNGTPWHSIWTGSGQVLWDHTGENSVVPNKVIEDFFANHYHNGTPA